MARKRRRAASRSGYYSRYERYSDYGGWGGFAPYVPVAARRAQANRKLAALRKSGQAVSPIQLIGRKIASTFWGRSWCDNLESYSDFANRLPRGRSYVRNGSVIDLRIGAGTVNALVSGSSIYEVRIGVTSASAQHWKKICAGCAGGIDSLVELLQGRFSKAVMANLCRQDAGLFPTPKEITFECSCPDWASMCKHVAAALYGVGARLDHQPELLFRLRQVNEHELIAQAGAGASLGTHVPPPSSRLKDGEDLAGIFGVDIAAGAAVGAAAEPPEPVRERPVGAKHGAPKKKAAPRKVSARKKAATRKNPAARKKTRGA